MARSLGLSRPTVAAYVQRAQVAGLSWPLPAGLDAATLEQRLFPPSPATGPVPNLAPDWSTVHHELKRKGLTLFLLWHAYNDTPSTSSRPKPGPRLVHGAPRAQTQGRHLVPPVAGIQGHHAGGLPVQLV